MTTLVQLPALASIQAGDTFYAVRPSLPAPDAKVDAAALWVWSLGPNAASARGFFGATPIGQPASADQATYTLAQESFGATVGVAVATTAATQTTPWGFASAAQANDVVTRLNQLRVDVKRIETILAQVLTDQGRQKTLDDALRAALVSLGLIKGAA